MEKPVQLSIITPETVLYDAPVEYVGVPGTLGDFGVLRNHSPLLSSLRVGTLSYKVEGKMSLVYVGGGFVEVTKEAVTVLADIANPADLIDVDRATRAKERAEARLKEKVAGVDHTRAQAALDRAVARLQIVSILKS